MITTILRRIALATIGLADRLDGHPTNVIQQATIAGRIQFRPDSVVTMRHTTVTT